MSVYSINRCLKKRAGKVEKNLESTEKIRDLIKLLNMNQDHLCYELTSLAAKVDNFLDDREMVLSGQLLSVRYAILTEENTNESVGIDAKETVEIEANGVLDKASPRFDDCRVSTVQEENADETVEINTTDNLDYDSPSFDDSPFAIVY